MTKILASIIGLIFFNLSVSGQDAPFNIFLEPMSITGLGGLQSFAFGQDGGKWLIIGGRLDGLHRRQPFAAFDVAGNNNQLIVIDPVTKEKWTASLASLPISIREQLSSTNMNFHQEGDYLYIIGGYGYSATLGDHTTFSNLSAIKVSDVINSIITKSNFTSYFRQTSDPKFQVTGGQLKKINNTYYLMGGQKFIGKYNPMGPDHGPGFIQEYTNAIRKFKLIDNGKAIVIEHLSSYEDIENLHRRDFNAEAQILPNGEEGITMFSGVFQPNADLPFLNSVTIDSTNYYVNNTFQQYYNHYHCAVLPMYSVASNEMHNVFFGGIAQYYDNLGVLVQDNNVPFTKTIARVTRNANGSLAEYKLPIEMPILLGAGAEFISNKNIPHFNNEVFKLDQITTDSTLVGYIYGGIISTSKNIFFTNTGSESSASSQIFKVYVIKNKPLSTHDLNDQSIGTLKMRVSPNPNNGDFVVKFNLTKKVDTKISIYSINGKLIEEKLLTNLSIGENTYHRKTNDLDIGGVFIITIETPFEKATRKVILVP